MNYENEYDYIERAERAFDAEERVYARQRHDDDAIEGRAELAGRLRANKERLLAAVAPFFSEPRRTMPGYAQIANGIYVRVGNRKATRRAA